MKNNTKRKIINKFKNFLIGFPTLFIIAVLFVTLPNSRTDLVEGFEMVAMGVVVATVCTVGIGGLVIVILSVFTGSIILSLIKRYNLSNFRVSNHEFHKEEAILHSFSDRKANAMNAVKDYIIKSVRSGIDLKEVEDKLLKVGWSIDDIKQAIKEVEFLDKI